jgi:hypothetical protein
VNSNPWTSAAELDLYGTPASPTLQGDLNRDGAVNTLDWSVMNAAWFTNNAVADINRDGIVNSIDFGLLNREWGRSV